MNRRNFNKLAGLFAIGALSKGESGHAQMDTDAGLPKHPAGEEVVLEDHEVIIAFDSISGALVRMERKSSGWKVERRVALGVSFRLHTPLANRRDNFVLGVKQRAVSVKKI